MKRTKTKELWISFHHRLSSDVRQHASRWLAILYSCLCFLLVPFVLCVRPTARVQARLQGRALRTTRREASEKKHIHYYCFHYYFLAFFLINLNFKFFSVCLFRGFSRLYEFLFVCLLAAIAALISILLPSPITTTTILQIYLFTRCLWDWPCLLFDFFSSFSSFFKVGQQHSTKLHSQLFFFFILILSAISTHKNQENC